MIYFCLIETSASSVPHMEPLDANDLPEAAAQTRQAIRGHQSVIAAHVFGDGYRLETILPDAQPSPAMPGGKSCAADGSAS